MPSSVYNLTRLRFYFILCITSWHYFGVIHALLSANYRLLLLIALFATLILWTCRLLILVSSNPCFPQLAREQMMEVDPMSSAPLHS